MKTLSTIFSVGFAVLLAGTAVAEDSANEQEHLTLATSDNYNSAQWSAEDLAPGNKAAGESGEQSDPLAALNNRLNRDLNQRLEQKLDLTIQLDR